MFKFHFFLFNNFFYKLIYMKEKFTKNVEKFASSIRDSFSELEELNNKSAKFNYLSKNNIGPILAPILSVLLILYASLAAPKLPKSVVKLFNNTLAKIIFIFLMLIISGMQPLFSIISSICILLMIQLLAYYESSDRIMNIINKSNTNSIEKINISDDLDDRDNISGNDSKKLYSVVNNNDDENKKISAHMPNSEVENNSTDIIGYTDPDFALYN